jgi:hypothetical protein
MRRAKTITVCESVIWHIVAATESSLRCGQISNIDFFRVLPMARALFRATSLDSSAWTISIGGVPAEQRAPFDDTHFSEVWNDAERSRTAFVRTHVGQLLHQIRRAVINRISAQANTAIAPGADGDAGTPNVP